MTEIQENETTEQIQPRPQKEEVIPNYQDAPPYSQEEIPPQEQAIPVYQKVTIILGLRGQGKTELGKFFLRSTPKCFVYDPMGEYPQFDRYIPENPADIQEYDMVMQRHILPKMKQGEIRLFLTDELDNYALPKPTPLPSGLRDINNYVRHYPSGFIGIARKAVQLYNNIPDLADNLIFFRLTSENDLRYIRQNISKEAEGLIRSLPDYHFLHVDSRRKCTLHKPIFIER